MAVHRSHCLGILLTLLLLPSGCGAPSQQSKVANAVLTLLTNTILGFATKDPLSTLVSIPCGSGDASEGSFSYEVPASLSDPSELLRNPNAAAALTVNFNKCVIHSCHDTLTIDGGTASLGMGVTAAELIGGAVPASFVLTVDNQTATGIVNQTISYAYKIEATFTTGSSSSLKGITIKEASPANPLTIGKSVLTADKILSLADGC